MVASSILQDNVTRAEWTEHLHNTLSGLGELKQRSLRSSEYTTELEAVPDGEYVILVYESSYTEDLYVTEVVGMVKEADSSWRAIGYHTQ